MDKYDLLKQRIESYLEMPDFIDDEYQISAASLIEMLKKRFNLLKDETIVNRIKDDIEKSMKQPKKIHLFKSKEDDEKSEKCVIEYSANLEKSKLHIWRYGIGSFDILKDCDSNELYFETPYSTRVDTELVRKHYDEIMEIFSLCEYFTSLVDGSINEHHSDKNPNFKPQVFSDGFLDIKIKYTDDGKVTSSIAVSREADPDKVCARVWLNRKTLNEILKENKDIIIRKIPIDIDELNKVCRQIYDEEHQIKPKVKVLQNNSFKK